MTTDYTEKSKVGLPEDERFEALRKLFDNKQQTEQVINKELPVFQLYINNAIGNVAGLFKNAFSGCSCSIGWDTCYDYKKIDDFLKKDDDTVKKALVKLANFLWLFKIDNPAAEYAEYELRQRTRQLVKYLYMLRNFFCHINEKGNGALFADHSFYTFFAGELTQAALRAAASCSTKTDKLFKMKMMNIQEICKVKATANSKDEKYVHEKCSYAFTRKGLILLICMALYKNEATEFCQQLHDLKLCRKSRQEEQEMEDSEETALRKKKDSRLAMHAFFTYYSMRRSYNAVYPEERNFACATDILGYLNKVPTVAWDYLALKSERSMLEKLRQSSTESEALKATKYELHRRSKDRTLAFYAGYCEDFNILPSIHFKRLDISENIGRKRYEFGINNENDCRQNRHYVIKDDAIRFEWRAKEHHGDIHIAALRSAVSKDELRRMIICSIWSPDSVNKALDNYFTAYHRILEMALMEGANQYIDRKNYLDDLKTVTGATEDELKDDDNDNAVFRKKMAPYFPENLTRFFIPKDNIPSDKELTDRLSHEISSQIDWDKKLIAEMQTNREWRRIAREERPEPPPTQRRMHDGDLIHLVFRTINLYLSPNNKYRQLPRGQRHRGSLDYEFQTRHATVGRFPADPNAFWDMLKGVIPIYAAKPGSDGPNKRTIRERIGEKNNPADDNRRAELAPLYKVLHNVYNQLLRNDNDYLEQHPRYDINPRQIKARPSLELLTEAALICHMHFCEDELKKLRQNHPRETLENKCRRFGLRIGLPLSERALLSTVLRIDYDKWSTAYNYTDHAKWVDRDLKAAEHIVNQIPLLNGFTVRLINTMPQNKQFENCLRRDSNRAEPQILFAKAVAIKQTGNLTLRDYYGEPASGSDDAKVDNVLLRMRTTASTADTAWDSTLPEELRSALPIPGKRELYSKAVELRKTKDEDQLLLHIAMEYDKKYKESESYAKSKKGTQLKSRYVEEKSIYDYFESTEQITLGNNLKVLLRHNDRLRAVFAQVRERADVLYGLLTAEQQKNGIDFYDLVVKMHEVEAKDQAIRLAMIDLLFQLENKVDTSSVNYNVDDALLQNSSDRGKDRKEIIHQREYECYLRYVGGKRQKDKEKKMPLERFDRLVEFRNKLFHNGFNLSQAEQEEAKAALRCFGIIPPEDKAPRTTYVQNR